MHTPNGRRRQSPNKTSEQKEVEADGILIFRPNKLGLLTFSIHMQIVSSLFAIWFYVYAIRIWVRVREVYRWSRNFCHFNFVYGTNLIFARHFCAFPFLPVSLFLAITRQFSHSLGWISTLVLQFNALHSGFE